jgi:hypothetical protein
MGRWIKRTLTIFRSRKRSRDCRRGVSRSDLILSSSQAYDISYSGLGALYNGASPPDRADADAGKQDANGFEIVGGPPDIFAKAMNDYIRDVSTIGKKNNLEIE